jgi:cell division septum initiation protein DivIVA
MPTKLKPEIIIAAIEGFQAQKTKLAAQIAELRQMLSGGPVATAATPEPAKRKRRKMSAAGRRAIAEAQRKRWAASKKAAQPLAPKAAPKAKRRLSAAGRKAIVAATKKRWAAIRAAKAKAGKLARIRTAAD